MHGKDLENTNLVRGMWGRMTGGSEGLWLSMGTGIYRVTLIVDTDFLISLVYPAPHSKTDMGSPTSFQ